MDIIERARQLRQTMMQMATTMSDADAIGAVELFNFWDSGNVLYQVGDRVRYGKDLYKCIVEHESLEELAPDKTPSLWQDLNESAEYQFTFESDRERLVPSGVYISTLHPFDTTPTEPMITIDFFDGDWDGYVTTIPASQICFGTPFYFTKEDGSATLAISGESFLEVNVQQGSTEQKWVGVYEELSTPSIIVGAGEAMMEEEEEE